MAAKPVFEIGDERFPQYLRLFWREIRSLLEHDLSFFEEFKESVVDKHAFDITMEYLKNPIAAAKKHISPKDMGFPDKKKKSLKKNKDQKKEDEEAEARQIEIEEKYLEHSAAIKEQETTGLINELLHNDSAIKVLDRLLRTHNPSLYRCVHLYMDNHKSKCLSIYLDRFFSDKDPKFLDRIAACYDPEYAEVSLDKSCKKPFEDFRPKFGLHEEVDLHHWARCILRGLPKLKFADDEWFFHFIRSLNKDPYNRAVLTVLMPDYQEQLAARDAEMKAKMEADRRKMCNQREEEKLVTEEKIEIRPQSAYKKFMPRNSDADMERMELRLRNYQEELVGEVEHAINNKNTVVCAPTGSGKTEVCIFIALRHLNAMRWIEKKPARVVMLVPKIPLVLQQMQRFHQYLRGGGEDDSYCVNGYSGSEGPKEDERTGQFLASDVVVMTPQILINMLNDPREDVRVYICDITLIIFDEVHHCTKNHVYKQVMDLVDEYKYAKPQIVGLTASLMTTGGTNMESGLESIYRLLANVTATALSTVKIHTEELSKHVSRPDEEISKEVRPNRDLFQRSVVEVIAIIQGSIMDQLKALTKPNDKGVQLKQEAIKFPDAKRAEPYISQLNALRYEIGKINRGDFKYEPAVAIEYLLALAHGLAINDLMPAKFALKAITMQMEELTSTYKNETSKKFFNMFQRSLDSMKQQSDVEEDKPMLKKLKSILVEQFTRDPSSRGIIFVEQRSTASNLREHLNSCKLLGGKRDFGFVTSSREGSKLFGQTKEDQKATLRDFDSGKLKVVVSTSVLDEGIDVRSCNLIIKYNVSSTSVSRIQKMGRARAHGSKSWFLCIDDRVANAEYDAIIGENLLRNCVKHIQHNGEMALARQVTKHMDQIRKERAAEKRALEQKQLQLCGKRYEVMCSLGNHKICDSTDIRLIQSHYVVMNPNVWENLEVVATEKMAGKFIDEQTTVVGKTHCLGRMTLQELDVTKGSKPDDYCGCEMGKIVKTCGVYLPQLVHSKLAFRLAAGISGADGDDPVESRKKNWNEIGDTLFFIPHASSEDLGLMANALIVKGRNNTKQVLDLQCEKIKRAAARELQRRRDVDERRAQMAKNKVDWQDPVEEEQEERKPLFADNDQVENELSDGDGTDTEPF